MNMSKIWVVPPGDVVHFPPPISVAEQQNSTDGEKGEKRSQTPNAQLGVP
jgi:hypothetical protein